MTSANLKPLSPTARSLSEKTSLPVKAKQVLSSVWLLLAADPDELVQQAAAKLGKHGLQFEKRASDAKAREF